MIVSASWPCRCSSRGVLQNDLVKPIGVHQPLPSKLHVGHEEARRLMGADPSAVAPRALEIAEQARFVVTYAGTLPWVGR